MILCVEVPCLGSRVKPYEDACYKIKICTHTKTCHEHMTNILWITRAHVCVAAAHKVYADDFENQQNKIDFVFLYTERDCR